METKAKLRHLRIAPRKVRLLIGLVRGMKVQEAIAQMQFSQKDAARPVRKLIESAVANARHNHDMDPESLIIKTAFVDEGKTLKRWTPRAMGRATPIRKRCSHITIVLEGDVIEKKKKVKKEEINKTEVAEEEKALELKK
ncbi:MAG: 50S ribosomal protein L22 [Candidatus Magasanikbacteria bacterium CG_4_9_14_3_um_filter_32_9]|uniref:Large ribosomal subunit protein uL22 n=1 Tax=Candidatus Magasanikbacteria bacterium CG_4_9_14_3_um_filter_32_9 TaxID=1974644 RepID=A0A2M7Z7P2_9BACT|nr:MAG: 50S ribosomal protein L22 [Candidatus Magasanikbacteria bacterium CG_4_9_14_3_um_filter_32_9]